MTLCDPDRRATDHRPAIGNCQLYVVDSHMQPVPIGVPGELLIGGANVAALPGSAGADGGAVRAEPVCASCRLQVEC